MRARIRRSRPQSGCSRRRLRASFRPPGPASGSPAASAESIPARYPLPCGNDRPNQGRFTLRRQAGIDRRAGGNRIESGRWVPLMERTGRCQGADQGVLTGLGLALGQREMAPCRPHCVCRREPASCPPVPTSAKRRRTPLASASPHELRRPLARIRFSAGSGRRKAPPRRARRPRSGTTPRPGASRTALRPARRPRPVR